MDSTLDEGRDAVVRVDRLTKDYGRGRGVFDASFSVSRGEVFGFLGPNGAGKTVTMRHLMGFVRPDSGSVRILGFDCFRERPQVQAHLGYLPGEIALMDDMSTGAYVDLVARMRGVTDRRRIDELSEMFELDPRAKIRSLSKGNKQKVGIVCAFMGTPDVLLLDEPTSGLDPLGQERFVELVLAEKRRGATVFLSSHIFEEVGRTCDRVAFIKQGRIVAVRGLDELASSQTSAFEVAFATTAERDRYLSGHASATGSQASSAIVRTADVDGFVKDLAAYAVRGLSSRERTLEEVFLDLYETR